MRRLLLLLVVGLVLLVAGVLGCEAWIALANKGRIYDNADTIPPREVGLVLGTSKKLRGGQPNPYFQARMDAAARLFRLGKVKRLLLSGDHRERGYNEPADMKRALLDRHVPAEAIELDSAGVRTLDSVLRASRVFKLDHFTIISQREHAERALLIAGHYHIDAIAFAAEDVPFQAAWHSHVHEWLAQVKAVLDVYVLQTPPRPPAQPHKETGTAKKGSMDFSKWPGILQRFLTACEKIRGHLWPSADHPPAKASATPVPHKSPE